MVYFNLNAIIYIKLTSNMHAILGTQTYLINTLRQTLLALENSIQSAFMHPNWSLLRKSWLTAVGACTKPSDFSKAMIILQVCCYAKK